MCSMMCYMGKKEVFFLAEINIYVDVVPRSSTDNFWMHVQTLLVGCSRSNVFQRNHTLFLHRNTFRISREINRALECKPEAIPWQQESRYPQGMSSLGSFLHLKESGLG